jgi:hypothetical protein
VRVQEFGTAELERIIARVLAAASGDDPLPVEATRLLVREYARSGRNDLRDALGMALAHALNEAEEAAQPAPRTMWLTLFVDAAAVADDERSVAAMEALAAGLRAAWPSALPLVDGVAAVEACLRASLHVRDAGLVPAAIDELERIVGGAYEPGDGVRGGHGAQIAAASALLTAYEITGRLPYSMLAEELMHASRRLAGDRDIVSDSDEAAVCVRLAALHADSDYRSAAIIADAADFHADAVRLLERHAARIDESPLEIAARYGLALREVASLR